MVLRLAFRLNSVGNPHPHGGECLMKCPRCLQHEITHKNPESLFFRVLICDPCADEGVRRVKRPWRRHPEMAEHVQKQLGILRY